MAQLRDTTIEGLLNVLGEITSTTPLSIENGGTNASNKADARQNINYIGLNPISSINDDTTAVWKTFRTGVARINTTGLLTDQPTQYGFILSMVAGDDVRQLWLSAAGGDMYHRGGNASGWSHSWRKVLDVKNTADYVVDTGSKTDGDYQWSWIKWDSGKLDIKLIFSSTFTTTYSSGSAYYTKHTFNVNSAVPLISDSIVDVEIHKLSGNGLTNFEAQGFSGKTVNYWIWCTTSMSSVTNKVAFNITGKWK